MTNILSSKQHKTEFYFLIWFDNCRLLIEVLNPVTFNVITVIFGFIFTIMILGQATG